MDEQASAELPDLSGAGRHDEICAAFQKMAMSTWHDLKDWMEISEESITDYKLLSLKREIPHAVWVEKFNKREEADFGADWEW